MANKDFSESQRNTIWRKYFGGTSSGTDVFGRLVSKGNFECDHVYPKSKGGKTTVENGMPLAPKSNEQKSDDLRGVVNGKSFRVEGGITKGILYVNGIKKSK